MGNDAVTEVLQRLEVLSAKLDAITVGLSDLRDGQTRRELEHGALAHRFEEHAGVDDERFVHNNDAHRDHDTRIRDIELIRAKLAGVVAGVTALASVISAAVGWTLGMVGSG